MREPSEILLQGRRFCESISGYTLLEDLTWLPVENKWVIKFSLSSSYIPTNFVPAETSWYAFLSDDYPFGELSILPAAEGSITATFPHMNYNTDLAKPWRSGDICIKTSYGAWKNSYFNSEPFDVSRLQWSVKRSIAWLNAAATGTLQSAGDPYEFPHFPSRDKKRWAFSETTASFQTWDTLDEQSGILNFFTPSWNKHLAVVTDYFGRNGKLLHYQWGTALNKPLGDQEAALWFMCPEIPVLPPWQIPMKWGELFTLCKNKNWNLKSFLEEKLVKQKHLNNIKVLALGFPVATHIGKESERIHWFAIRMPGLLKVLKGFRPNTPEWRKAQFTGMFAGHQSIKWLSAENWAKDQITTRGTLSGSISELNICVVGVGAVGSYLTELLIRLGCEKLTLLDDDGVSIGNFSRHTLTMQSLVYYKAASVAERLNAIFPIVQTKAVNGSLKNTVEGSPDFLDQFQIVIDCTAEDDVLSTLSRYCRLESQIVFSVSLGQEAQSLLGFFNRYPHEDLLAKFEAKSSGWTQRQQETFPNPNFPLEGIGCWHPIFPARIDDVHGLVACTVRRMERFLAGNDSSEMVIIERDAAGTISIQSET